MVSFANVVTYVRSYILVDCWYKGLSYFNDNVMFYVLAKADAMLRQHAIEAREVLAVATESSEEFIAIRQNSEGLNSEETELPSQPRVHTRHNDLLYVAEEARQPRVSEPIRRPRISEQAKRSRITEQALCSFTLKQITSGAEIKQIVGPIRMSKQNSTATVLVMPAEAKMSFKATKNTVVRG